MADFDEIKNRFGERVKAQRANLTAAADAESARVAAAFAPIRTAADAISAAIADLADIDLFVSVLDVTPDRDGSPVLRVDVNRDGARRVIDIKLAPALGQGELFWVDGFGQRAATYFGDVQLGRSAVNNEVTVPAAQADAVAAALEAFATEFYSEG